ncbi:TIGR00093: pseudouridine synthase [Rubrobacter radiotolerans]|uniref:Pseudouridine synthase n=1 Tax=Rubrobacter radiotolerans TaxID=42256 RepID=A0A023X3G4_RUBRA|nr:pseudouridine synthase [Rubrobacter radiotolerans]AHY46731.1 TIGR00093: pseudouridine synthase [Rubrobacter radiotolerans]MDX5894138.1 pseudouridine synthase [Rubrobacter radiotolerans]SMC05289.1 ribosomal large subunit pseudouridine synthase B [Rubrobacter radiotolerans DSM 5868]
MRLQTYLARAGAAPSRRKAEALIVSGRVAVGGEIAELGRTVGPEDRVTLDGRPVELPESRVYLALNKPSGYLSAMSDDRGRPTVADLMPDVPGLVPVGRLDAQTTGLILLTNDGDFANLVAHPSYTVEKEYALLLAPPVPDEALDRLAAGPLLDDGPMLPPKLTRPRKKGRKVQLNMTIHEGRNRIVRRACAAAGLRLLSLSRVRVGPVRLGDLQAGEHRPLSREELLALFPGVVDSGPGTARTAP